MGKRRTVTRRVLAKKQHPDLYLMSWDEIPSH